MSRLIALALVLCARLAFAVVAERGDLGDGDAKTRYAAIVSLRIMTGASHAYHPWAPDAARTKPLAAWRAWLRRLERACRA